MNQQEQRRAERVALIAAAPQSVPSSWDTSVNACRETGLSEPGGNATDADWAAFWTRVDVIRRVRFADAVLAALDESEARENKNTPGDGSAGASQSAHTPPAKSSPVSARDAKADESSTLSVDRQSRDSNAQVVRLAGERLSDPAPLSRDPLTEAEAAWLEWVSLGDKERAGDSELVDELRARRDSPTYALEEKYRDACVAEVEAQRRWLRGSDSDIPVTKCVFATDAAKRALDQAKEGGAQ